MISKATGRVSFHVPSATLLLLPFSISRSSFLHSLGAGARKCAAQGGFGQNWPVEMEGQAKKKMAKSECGENGKVRAKWRKVSRCYWPLADGELWMPARWIFDAPKWASCSESGLKVATALMAKRWANWNSSSRPVGAFFLIASLFRRGVQLFLQGQNQTVASRDNWKLNLILCPKLNICSVAEK